MKSVTEFASFTLSAANKAKASLAAEGKTPEEIQENLATTYKLEGDKLKYFMAAMDLAATNPENLKRVLVQSFAEGENVPKGVTKVEETYYFPEYHATAKRAEPRDTKDARGGKGKGRGNDRGGRGGDRGPKREGGGPNAGPEGKSASAGGPPSRPVPKVKPQA